MEKYKLVDAKFKCLIEKLREVFSDKEINAVHDFLDFDEYGLALDTVLGTFIEEKKQAPAEIIKLIKELLAILELNPKIYHSVEDINLLVTKKYLDREKWVGE